MNTPKTYAVMFIVVLHVSVCLGEGSNIEMAATTNTNEKWLPGVGTNFLLNQPAGPRDNKFNLPGA